MIHEIPEGFRRVFKDYWFQALYALINACEYDTVAHKKRLRYLVTRQTGQLRSEGMWC